MHTTTAELTGYCLFVLIACGEMRKRGPLTSCKWLNVVQVVKKLKTWWVAALQRYSALSQGRSVLLGIKALVVRVWISETWHKDIWMNSSEDIGSADALKPSDLTEVVHLSRIKASIYPILENVSGLSPQQGNKCTTQELPQITHQGHYKCSSERKASINNRFTMVPSVGQAVARRGNFRRQCFTKKIKARRP